MEKANSLKRTIGVWGLSANIANIIIGAGIFVLPAVVAEKMGSSSIIAFLCCGFLVALLMFCFAELGSKIKHSGGAYKYIEMAFGSYWGFLSANLFVCSCIAADAAVANALWELISGQFSVLDQSVYRTLFFVLLFFGLTALNISGVRNGIGLVKFNVIVKLIPLLLIVILGIPEIKPESLIWEATPSFMTIGETCLILFFAFQGAETALTIGGEVEKPNRTFPRAIALSLVGILLLYISLQLVSQGVLGSELALQKENPLGRVTEILLGPWGLIILSIGAGVSMFGNISGEILSMPRVLYRAAKDKVIFPKALALVHPKYNTPYISIITYASLGFCFALFGGFKTLAVLSSAAILLLYIGVALSTIRLKKILSSNDGYSIPFGKTIPVLACLIILGFLFNLNQDEISGILLMIGLFSLMYLIFYIYTSSRK